MRGACGYGEVCCMRVRKPAVAGSFYSADAQELRAQVEGFLGQGEPDAGVHGIVSPHAGYAFSGAVAGAAWSLVPPETREVVFLGPSHHLAFSGVALDAHEAWETPLGRTELLDAPVGGLFRRLPEAHAPEHSLEVQLPFLQVVAPGARMLPLLIHDISPAEAELVAARLRSLFPAALWVVSSDLSHYLPLAEARERDAQTLAALQRLSFSAPLDACGRYPLLVAMAACRAQGWELRLVRYATSAAVTGDTSAVVGYAALRF